MNTVASLPDRLAIHARDCVKAADMDTDVVLSKQQIDAMADDMAEAALVLATPAVEGASSAGEADSIEWGGCTCQDCGIRYYADLIVPDEVWARVNNGHSLLCAACIMERIVALGIWSAARAVDVDTPPPAPAAEQPEVVITTDESGRCVAVTRQDSEGRILHTIWEASEHGGGGEAVAWITEDGRVISARQKAAALRDGGASASSVKPYSIPCYTTPPTPSAPVVDETVQDVCDDILHKLEGWAEAYPESAFGPVTDAERKEHGSLISRASASMGRHIARVIERDIAKLRAALSRVSAPVGVEAVIEWCDQQEAMYGEDGTAEGDARASTFRAVRQRLTAALTPPAAAQRSDKEQHVNAIRTLWEMGWRWKGGKWVAPAAAPRVEEGACAKCGAPTDPDWGHIGDCRPAASEDGLPEEIEAIVCPLEDDAAAMLERLPDDGTAHTMQAAAALIRRLAASGQANDGEQTCCDRAYKDGYDTGKMHASGQEEWKEIEHKARLWDDLVSARSATAKEPEDTEWKRLARSGRVMEAIKACRTDGGYSLREAKECVESYLVSRKSTQEKGNG